MSVPQPPESLDPQRRAAQTQLERAVGEGRLTLDEFTDRAGLVWRAGDPAEIDRVLADLPAPVVGQTVQARSTLVSLIGDIRRRGRWALRRRTTAVLLIGDVRLDLRGAVVTERGDTVLVDVFGLIGDVEVTVPEGVEAELTGFTLLGGRHVDLAPVARVPGTPVVRIRVFTLIGDTTLRSAG
jgi:hypothetical protein